MDLQDFIRDIPDFPKAGILFKDITPLLANGEALKAACDRMAQSFVDQDIKLVVGMESRGFLFGPSIAQTLACGFAPLRKPGKLPYKTESVKYGLEYGQDELEIHIDACKPGDKVLIVDDLLATGGTAVAAKQLIEKIGGIVAGYSFLVELEFLHGRKRLEGANIFAEIVYT
jgi:adenine phosphoribosyltransferase